MRLPVTLPQSQAEVLPKFSTGFVRKMEQESFSFCAGLLVVYQETLHNAGLCITALPHPVRKGPRSCFRFRLPRLLCQL